MGCSQLPFVAGCGHLAHSDGFDHVAADEAQSTVTRPHSIKDFCFHAHSVHFYPGIISSGACHLLDVEQHPIHCPAVDHYETRGRFHHRVKM